MSGAMSTWIPTTEHVVSRRGRPWPRLDPAAVERLLTRLGEPWDRTSFEDAQAAYTKVRRRNLLGTVAILAVTVFVSVTSLTLVILIALSEWELARKVGSIVALLVLVTVTILISDALLRYPSDNATGAFLLRAGFFCRVLDRPARERDLALALGQLGRIARALFASLQRSRLTWTAPPEVADRALRITHPLVDIDTTGGFGERGPNQRDDLELLRCFVLDVTALVIVGRAHLIPRCRASLYSDIPGRYGKTVDDRAALHLDPMRHRTRWEVVKDFVLPLATWFGLAISLWVALSRPA